MVGCLMFIFIGLWQLAKLTIWLTIQAVRLLIVAFVLLAAGIAAVVAAITTSRTSSRPRVRQRKPSLPATTEASPRYGPKPAPIISPDGYWLWDGGQWVPYTRP